MPEVREPPSARDPASPPVEVTLPLKKRGSSRPPEGARPRRVFVPSQNDDVEASASVETPFEDQPTLPSARAPEPRATSPGRSTLVTKATVPSFSRVGPARPLGTVAPAPRDARREPSSPPPSLVDTPVLEVRHSARRSSRGLALDRLVGLLPGRRLAGRYRIGELVGRGAMGVIFAADDESPAPFAPRLAVKLLDPEIAMDPPALDRFRIEALAPRDIGSEHVVRVFEADVCRETLRALAEAHPSSGQSLARSEGAPYIAMEMLYGVDLREHLRQKGPLPGRELLSIVQQISPTLDRAHALGIVHRDLKPANLFLTRRPDGGQLVKILDFGARRAEQATSSREAEAGVASPFETGFFGTPWYMAPEQIDGDGAGPASDRWALALVVFRLLTGESYWPPGPTAELLAAIVTGPKVPPSRVIRDRGVLPFASIGEAFDDWFFRACSVAPTARFASAVEQESALARALSVDARR